MLVMQFNILYLLYTYFAIVMGPLCNTNTISVITEFNSKFCYHVIDLFCWNTHS